MKSEDRCRWMPAVRRLLRLAGTITCGRGESCASSSHNTAALRWLSAAPVPQASTAASQRPSRGQVAPAERVDATVDAEEPVRRDEVANRRRRPSETLELIGGDEVMLAARLRGERRKGGHHHP
jgi:hypothetical protein